MWLVLLRPFNARKAWLEKTVIQEEEEKHTINKRTGDWFSLIFLVYHTVRVLSLDSCAAPVTPFLSLQLGKHADRNIWELWERFFICNLAFQYR